MKIDVAYGKDLDDSMLEQLLYMEADAYACYESIDSGEDNIVICAIPTESLKQFKKRTANVIFLMKTKTIKSNVKLVGMACLSRSKKDMLHLHTVFVKSNWRRKGIGNALIKRALREAKKMKCAINLSVNPLNYDAMRLYESLGFKIGKGQKLEMHALEKKNGKSR